MVNSHKHMAPFHACIAAIACIEGEGSCDFAGEDLNQQVLNVGA